MFETTVEAHAIATYIFENQGVVDKKQNKELNEA